MDFKAKIRQLLSQDVSPHSVALGSAFGMFFGFFPPFPLFGLKTGMAYLSSLLSKANVPASIIGVTLHDLFLPLLPVILWTEYQMGYWLLAHPHRFAPKLKRQTLEINPFHNWHEVERIAGPMLLGALIVGTLAALVTYLVAWGIFQLRHLRKMRQRAAQQALPPPA